MLLLASGPAAAFNPSSQGLSNARVGAGPRVHRIGMSDTSPLAARRAVLQNAVAATMATLVLPCYAEGPKTLDRSTPLETVYDTRSLAMEPTLDPRKFTKLDSGVRIADVKIGTGQEVVAGSKVSIQWVLRRSNGYFVDSSIGTLSAAPSGGTLSLGGDASSQFDPFIFTVGDGKAMTGINEGVVGMRQGGVRRLILPVKTGSAYTLPIDKSAGPLPAGFGPRRQLERELTKQDPYNYFSFEIEAIKVKPP